MPSIDFKTLFTSFNGRIDRKLFWVGLASVAAATAVVQAGIFATFNSSDAELAALVAVAPFIVPLLAICAKRIRDRGLSTWWLLIMGLPVGNLIWMVADLGMRPGFDEAAAAPANPATT